MRAVPTKRNREKGQNPLEVEDPAAQLLQAVAMLVEETMYYEKITFECRSMMYTYNRCVVRFVSGVGGRLSGRLICWRVIGRQAGTLPKVIYKYA